METHIKLSKEVKFILNELNKYGQGYIVGGAVRPNGTFNGLAAGTYMVIVTDANGCQDSISVTVNETPALVLVANTASSTCGNSN